MWSAGRSWTVFRGHLTMASRPRKPGGLRKVTLSPEDAMPFLKEAGVMHDGKPVSVFGYIDRAAHTRRVIARYADGWRADVRFRVDGSVAITQSLNLRLESRR